MKKIKVLLLMFLTVFMVGCGSEEKTVVEPTDYLNIIQNLGYTAEDHTSSFAYSEASYLINNNNMYVLYVKGKKKYDIEGLFLDECKNVYNLAKEGYKEKTDGSDNWVSLEVKDNEKYYYVVYVDDTYLQIKADLAQEPYAKEIIEKLGY